MTWKLIANTCKEKLKKAKEDNNEEQGVKGKKEVVVEPEFVIDSPALEETTDSKRTDPTVSEFSINKKSTKLEEEAIRMHKELLEDDTNPSKPEIKTTENKLEKVTIVEEEKIDKSKSDCVTLVC